MAIQRYGYFYDKQIYRYLLQVVRAFSGFEYMTGRRGDIEPQLKLAPAKMAKRSRMVAQIQQNGSDNVMNTVPQITVDLTGFRFDPERLQNPGHVGHVQVYERKRDPSFWSPDQRDGQCHHGRASDAAPVHDDLPNRHLDLEPRPEVPAYGADLRSHLSDLRHPELGQCHGLVGDHHGPPEAGLTWTSISVPVGNGTDLDIATIQLEIPMWLSPPAKVKRQQIIDAVITNINQGVYDDEGMLEKASAWLRSSPPRRTTVRFSRTASSPCWVAKTNEVDAEGNLFAWTISSPSMAKATRLRPRFVCAPALPRMPRKSSALCRGCPANQLSRCISTSTRCPPTP
jgi:hypothetical protein